MHSGFSSLLLFHTVHDSIHGTYDPLGSFIARQPRVVCGELSPFRPVITSFEKPKDVADELRAYATLRTKAGGPDHGSERSRQVTLHSVIVGKRCEHRTIALDYERC
jgi:hypothetical protein